MSVSSGTRGSRGRGRARELFMLLTRLNEAYEALLECVGRKRRAMACGDVAGIQACIEVEERHVREIQDREGLRRALLEQTRRDLRLPVGATRHTVFANAARRVPDSLGRRLLEAARTRDDAMKRLLRENRINAAVARGVMGHLRSIFELIGTGNERSVGYAADGAPVAVRDRKIIETLG